MEGVGFSATEKSNGSSKRALDEKSERDHKRSSRHDSKHHHHHHHHHHRSSKPRSSSHAQSLSSDSRHHSSSSKRLHGTERGSRISSSDHHKIHRDSHYKGMKLDDDFKVPGCTIIEAPDFESSSDEDTGEDGFLAGTSDRLRDDKGFLNLGVLEHFESHSQPIVERLTGTSKDHIEDSKAVEAEVSSKPNVPYHKSVLDVNYEFGDRGSNWRLMKLHKILESSKFSAESVEDLALKQYGDLALFYIAMEEKEELERRRKVRDKTKWVYKPTGRIAKLKGISISEPMGSSDIADTPKYPKLERMITLEEIAEVKIQMMKAKIRRDSSFKELEMKVKLLQSKYDTQNKSNKAKDVPSIKLGMSMYVDEDSLTVEQMMKQEKLSSAQSNVKQSIKNIASAKSFNNTDLDYQDENANNLANLSKVNKINISKMVEDPSIIKALNTCIFCMDNKSSRKPLPVLSTTQNFYLTLLPKPELTKFGCMIVPFQHQKNSLALETNDFEELKDIMQTLSIYYYEEFNQSVIFYEESISPTAHFNIKAIPIATTFTPGVLKSYFKAGIMDYHNDNESSHKAIIDTMDQEYSSQIAKEAPFYHVWFNKVGGLGHIIESDVWPKGDQFTRSIIGGFLEADNFKIASKTRFVNDSAEIAEFKRRFKKYETSE
ncbi:hypothetical protein CANARDRAFT_21767 [[Candida] arabinofermentans NRRL YB-2248]|uniref:Cwf19-like C-terminal domain-containing protein n=1 Tax=[Candida] arabinofermentans NRRL YB-2248 TaxID=983967 RepID=A0A1E4T4V6_9ASCO|nr:hypothetical protein CANARDRAFT_21767 [[Candida] arabinofermentans NRRL YB-2248]